MLDSFDRDRITGEGMLATAERVAADAGFAKDELDELTVHRYEQYEDALAADRAFQRRWMVPITAGSRRSPIEIQEDHGAKVIASSFARVEPGRMPNAPVPAARRALDDARLTFDDSDVA